MFLMFLLKSLLFLFTLCICWGFSDFFLLHLSSVNSVAYRSPYVLLGCRLERSRELIPIRRMTSDLEFRFLSVHLHSFSSYFPLYGQVGFSLIQKSQVQVIFYFLFISLFSCLIGKYYLSYFNLFWMFLFHYVGL